MLQLTTNLKTGKMEISEVPFPALDKGKILVRNHYSLISSGTESMKVSTARKGYIGKAKERPEQVKQVIDTVRKEGVASAYRKVMNKLDSLNALGYSTAGMVMEIGPGVDEFNVGDRVACAGADIANHAEVIAVPVNLAAKIPDNVSFEEACYSTVAAIALQGIRQADLRLGESCAVIGMGLIGQLTIQMLRAAGINTFGIDLDPATIVFAEKSGANLAFQRSDPQLEQAILERSGGYGIDAVIITAGTSSSDPVELAGRLCRVKGKVIIVGAVPTGFSRDNYFKKELDLRMSCSYGPGRYNRNYEEKGLDYPIGYVRWTENRNMQAFLDLVSQQKIDPGILTTHTFEFRDALKAYDLIMNREGDFIGILLKYDTETPVDRTVEVNKAPVPDGNLKISFIGAGSFALNSLLPNIKTGTLISVATAESHNSRSVAQKFGFKRATGSGDDIISEVDSNIVFVATRHNLHFEYVLKALQKGKHLFVEKPLCMTEDELEIIRAEYEKQQIHLMVGFNRRFAPFIRKTKRSLSESGPIAINYRINAGNIPPESWIQDKEIGGGRIIGEVCHFVDLAMFLSDSLVDAVSAFTMKDPLGLNDTLNINLLFKNGSIATISYFSNGSKELRKEYLEVFSSGMTIVINDFKTLEIYGRSRKKEKMISQDKGHKAEVAAFLNAIKNGEPTPISFEELYNSTLATFKIIESIKTGKTIKL